MKNLQHNLERKNTKFIFLEGRIENETVEEFAKKLKNLGYFLEESEKTNEILGKARDFIEKSFQKMYPKYQKEAFKDALKFRVDGVLHVFVDTLDIKSIEDLQTQTQNNIQILKIFEKVKSTENETQILEGLEIEKKDSIFEEDAKKGDNLVEKIRQEKDPNEKIKKWFQENNYKFEFAEENNWKKIHIYRENKYQSTVLNGIVEILPRIQNNEDKTTELFGVSTIDGDGDAHRYEKKGDSFFIVNPNEQTFEKHCFGDVHNAVADWNNGIFSKKFTEKDDEVTPFTDIQLKTKIKKLKEIVTQKIEDVIQSPDFSEEEKRTAKEARSKFKELEIKTKEKTKDILLKGSTFFKDTFLTPEKKEFEEEKINSEEITKTQKKPTEKTTEKNEKRKQQDKEQEWQKEQNEDLKEKIEESLQKKEEEEKRNFFQFLSTNQTPYQNHINIEKDKENQEIWYKIQSTLEEIKNRQKQNTAPQTLPKTQKENKALKKALEEIELLKKEIEILKTPKETKNEQKNKDKEGSKNTPFYKNLKIEFTPNFQTTNLDQAIDESFIAQSTGTPYKKLSSNTWEKIANCFASYENIKIPKEIIIGNKKWTKNDLGWTEEQFRKISGLFYILEKNIKEKPTGMKILRDNKTQNKEFELSLKSQKLWKAIKQEGNSLPSKTILTNPKINDAFGKDFQDFLVAITK